MSYHYGFLVETMVSILLLLTILYCVRLNKQLRLLKADERSLRATISELVTATEIADRAIDGLKSTMQEGEQALSERLERGEVLAAELDLHLTAGNQLLARLVRIAGVSRPPGESTCDPKCQRSSCCGAGLRRSHALSAEWPSRMNRLVRDVRLIPIVLFATISLLALKVSGLVFDGGYTFAERMQARYNSELQITSPDSVPEYPRIIVADKQGNLDAPGRKQAWAQEMFNFNLGTNNDITGSARACRRQTE